MLDREPFLRAIFATPDEDLPRLVFADWLDEHDDPAWAELIRVQCELNRLKVDRDRTDPAADELVEREERLLIRLNDQVSLDRFPNFGTVFPHVKPTLPLRGFRPPGSIEASVAELSDGVAFRRLACEKHPEWYGATRLKATTGRITSPEPLQTILTGPVTEHVVELDLSGAEEETRRSEDDVPVTVYEIKPVIAVRMVEHLAQMREVRRLQVLDLRNNNLDNDALNALAKSTNFIRLKRLLVSAGNHFRGRTWQRVQERFGPDVVE